MWMNMCVYMWTNVNMYVNMKVCAYEFCENCKGINVCTNVYMYTVSTYILT